MDEAFSVGLKSTIDELQTIPSNFKWQARACSRRQSRTLRSNMMRLVGQPDGILARVIAEIAHDLLAFRAAIHWFGGLIVRQVEKLVDLSERWTQVAMS